MMDVEGNSSVNLVLFLDLNLVILEIIRHPWANDGSGLVALNVQTFGLTRKVEW